MIPAIVRVFASHPASILCALGALGVLLGISGAWGLVLLGAVLQIIWLAI